ncbi:MAG: hypothetical protein M3Y91_16050 [Actinomycetota bacterium]|nr:hypothetical protein [Actinomycetota bacterium]
MREPATALTKVVVVAHGLILERAMGLLAAEGTIGLGGPPPHLDNGQWIAVEVAAAIIG